MKNYKNELVNFINRFYLEQINEFNVTEEELLKSIDLEELEHHAELNNLPSVNIPEVISSCLLVTNDDALMRNYIKELSIIDGNVTLAEIIQKVMTIIGVSVNELADKIGVSKKLIKDLASPDTAENRSLKSKIMLSSKSNKTKQIVRLMSYFGLNIREWLALRIKYDEPSTKPIKLYENELIAFGAQNNQDDNYANDIADVPVGLKHLMDEIKSQKLFHLL